MCLRAATKMRRLFSSLALLYAALGSYYVLESALEYPDTILASAVLAWAPALVVLLLVCPWLGGKKWADALPVANWVTLVPCLVSMAFFFMLMSDGASPSFGQSDAEELLLGAGLFAAPMAAMLVAVAYVFSLGMEYLVRWVKKNRS